MHGYLCYKTSCKTPPLPLDSPGLVAVDPFGGREVTPKKTKMLCTPARLTKPGDPRLTADGAPAVCSPDSSEIQIEDAGNGFSTLPQLPDYGDCDPQTGFSDRWAVAYGSQPDAPEMTCRAGSTTFNGPIIGLYITCSCSYSYYNGTTHTTINYHATVSCYSHGTCSGCCRSFGDFHFFGV